MSSNLTVKARWAVIEAVQAGVRNGMHPLEALTEALLIVREEFEYKLPERTWQAVERQLLKQIHKLPADAPRYACLDGHIEMQLKYDYSYQKWMYYRPAGHWEIGVKVFNGALVSDAFNLKHRPTLYKKLHEKPFVEITRKQFEKANAGYL